MATSAKDTYAYGRVEEDRPPPPYAPKPYGEDIEAGLPEGAGLAQHFGDYEQQIRLAFIRKVYSVLALQLVLTVLTSSLCMLVDPVRLFVLGHPGLLYFALFLSIGLLIALLCYKDKHPTNVYLLMAWTAVEAYTVGVVCASYASVGQGVLVVEAFGITATVFLGLTAFTFQSKIDFSFLGAALFACLWVLVLWGFVNLIFGWVPGVVYSLLGAIIFSLYIVFDTWLLAEKLQPDQWVVGCISLYLDILNLFLFILRLLSAGRER